MDRAGLAVGEAGGLERINRLAVIVATACAVPFFVVMLGTGLVAGRADLMVGSATPLVVGAIGVWQLSRPEPQAVVQMIAGAIMTMVYTVAVGAASRTGAVVALVALGMTGILFIRRRYLTFSAAFTIGIVATAYATEQALPAADRFMAAAASAMLFVFAGLLVYWLKRELQTGRARYRSLFDRAPIAIWEMDFSAVASWLDARRAAGVTDLAGYLDANPGRVQEVLGLIRILDVNRAAIALMEESDKQRLVGRVVPGRLSSGFSETYLHQVLSIWERHGSGEIETRTRTWRGRVITVHATWSTPVYRGLLDTRRVVATVVDITARKRTEDRLEQLLHSKDEFIASVSHELRTPLTAVVGLADELDHRFDRFAETELRELVGVIASQSLEMNHIVEDLLVAARRDLSRIPLAIQPFDMRRVVAAVIADLGEDAAGVQVASDLEGDPPLSQGDPLRAKQILRNLVVNARRYGGARVEIGISWSGETLVAVRDDGPPIPEDERDRIFDPYYRARQAPGTAGSVGLGLTVSRQLARLMGGDVTYRHDGARSEFQLRIPNAAPAAQAGRPHRPEAQAAPSHLPTTTNSL